MKIKIENWPIGFSLDGQPIFGTDQDGLALALRDVRDVLLKESDWIQNSDTQIPEEVKQDWLQYRQSLRDLPKSLVGVVLGAVVEFPEPPVSYRPRTWVNLVSKD